MTYRSYASQVTAHVRQSLFQQLEQGAEQILQSAQNIVPIDDGELIGGAVLSKRDSKNKLEIMIAYGTDPISAEYAIIQHENPFYNHAPGKQFKFLEQPFNQIAPQMLSQFRI